MENKETKPPTATPKLLDEEKRIVAERMAKIGRIALEIETILIREDINKGDFLEIIGPYYSNAQLYFSDFRNWLKYPLILLIPVIYSLILETRNLKKKKNFVTPARQGIHVASNWKGRACCGTL